GPGQNESSFGRPCLEDPVTVGAEQVAKQLEVPLVVLHDQDQLARHASPFGSLGVDIAAGRANLNVLPCPRRLSTHSRPPCNSRIRFERVSPSPVPSAAPELLRGPCWNHSKIRSS